MSAAMSSDLLTEAVKAWQRTRHPRWAALAEAAVKAEPARELVGAGKKKADAAAWDALQEEGDALDLPRLVTALKSTTAAEAATRVKVLGKRNDPRLFTLLLGVLEAPPWRANVFKEFVTACLEVLEATKDVRVREAWLELAPPLQGHRGDLGRRLGRRAAHPLGEEPRGRRAEAAHSRRREAAHGAGEGARRARRGTEGEGPRRRRAARDGLRRSRR
jgi:hypothetical protein